MVVKHNIELRAELWKIFLRGSTPEVNVIVLGIDPNSYFFVKLVGGRAQVLFSTDWCSVRHRQVATKPLPLPL